MGKKSRHYFTNKGPFSQTMVFPVVMYGCESWTIKKSECRRIDAFELWCWRRLLRVPWTARRSNQSILKEIGPEYSLEGLMLKLKCQYFGYLMQRNNSLEKTASGKNWRQEEKGTTEEEMVRWHYRHDRHELRKLWELVMDRETWGHKESNLTERLNWSWYLKKSLEMPILTMSQMPDLAQRVEIFSPKWGTVASQSVSHPGYVQNQNHCPRFFSLWITPDVVVLQSLSPVQLLATHGLQHARLPCPSPSSRVCSNSSPLGRWCHPTISSSDEMRFSWCPHEK